MTGKPAPSRRGNGDGTIKSTLEALAAKPAPSAETAEQVVLGSILQRPAVAEKVVDILGAEDFHADSHRVLYTEMLAVLADGEVPELELIVERLHGKDQLAAAGGIDYIAGLPDAAPEPDNIAQYAKIVHDRAAQRLIIRASTTALQSAFSPGNRAPADLIAEATQHLFDVADRSRAKGAGLKNLRYAAADAVGEIETAYVREDKDAPLGLTTGFIDLDRKTLGMQRGDFIVVAGRPAMGKTAFCLNIAENAAKTTPDLIAVFSMEMSATQLAMRMLASGTRIDATALRTGRIQNEDFEAISAALGPMSESSIYIDDTPGLSPMEVRARCQRLERETGKKLGLVIIDYLQLMTGTRSDYGNDDVLRVSDISSAQKKMARELDIPVLALAQLNRGLESRVNKRPMMSDLRGSGSIEQDTDLILFLYRDEVYNPDTADRGICEVIIGKNRNGPVGEVRLSWIADQLRFENSAYAGGY